MPNESSAIVQHLWNYCNVLRDDGDALEMHYHHILESLGVLGVTTQAR